MIQKLYINLGPRRSPGLRSAWSKHRTPLPPTRCHKYEVLTGDTIYLGCVQGIRSFILSALPDTEPREGRVSITSPIGRALLGRHPGEVVRLITSEGDLHYTILKII